MAPNKTDLLRGTLDLLILQTLVLGVDTPASQIAAVAREVRIGAVAISCIQLSQRNCSTQVRSLRRELPRRCTTQRLARAVRVRAVLNHASA